MEFYHNQIKVRLLNETDQSVYQRADWLVNKLTTKVHSYFWLDEYPGKDHFARYWKEEWMCGPTAWRKSLAIPDAHVLMDGELAKVFDLENQEPAHFVRNPGSEYAICDCSWAKMVRDHAASLAAWVQMQLNKQICQESQENTTEQQFGSLDITLHSENQCPTSNTISSPNENRPAKKHKLIDTEAGDLGDNPVHHTNTEDIYDNEMEVDSSSISTSPTQLSSANENTISLIIPDDEILNNSGPGQTMMILPCAEEFEKLDGFGNMEKYHSAGLMIIDVETQSVCDVPSTDCSLDGEDILSTSVRKSDPMEQSSPIVAKQSNVNVGEEVSDGIGENGGEDSTVVEASLPNDPPSSDTTLHADSDIDV